MKRPDPGRALCLLGAVCLGAAAIFAGWSLRGEMTAAQGAKQGAAAVAAMVTAAAPPEEELLEADHGASAAPAPEETAPGEEEADGTAYLGLLTLPDLGRTVPVGREWSPAALKECPCRYAGDITGGLVIAGHNYRAHFGDIDRLEPGAAVLFTDMTGVCRRYRAEQVEYLDGGDAAAMLAGDWDLTLFTCTPGGRGRAALRCSLAEDECAE